MVSKSLYSLHLASTASEAVEGKFIVSTNLALKLWLCIAQCLKITEKVSLNITNEASYVYISRGQFDLASVRKPEACGQTVEPDRSILKGKKMAKMAKMKNSNETF